jgi:hypothetical protein
MMFSDTRAVPSALAAVAIGLFLLAAAPAASADEVGADGHPGPARFLRGAYQFGSVLETNDFLAGDNQSGQPIDSFQSLRLELGWQTDGSRDWHHVYNFPTYGLGLYGADLDNDEELGTPTSLYGFFAWPLVRTGRWTISFDLAFGLTNDWKPYDPINNPKNVAMGLGRSVHIETGASAQYRLGRRWSLVGGVTGTHFSNGGTQRPNHGLNQIGPILFARYDVDEPIALPVRRTGIDHERTWDLTLTASAGKRNLDLPLADPDLRERYGNQSYFIGNLTVGAGYRVSYKSRIAVGLDLCYDETVGDLQRIDAFNQGQNADPVAGDNLELGIFGGYEIHAHRTHLLIHLGYRTFTKEVTGRLPRFYQRLGVRQFVYQDWFVGLNVRFHEIGSADNLEWTMGYRFQP